MAETDAAPGGQAAPGLAGSVRAWLHDGVRLLRVRLELFGVEAREHALATVELLLTGLAAVLLLTLGLGFLSVLLTVLLWDSHRVLALTVFATLFLTLGGVACALLLSRWRSTRRWFEATLGELRQDGERLAP